MKKTNKILEAKPEIIIIVIVLILIVLAFIQPIHVFITKNTIKKEVEKNILKDIDYTDYQIDGKYFNILNIQMKDDFEDYEYSKKKNTAKIALDKFTDIYKNYEDTFIDKTSTDYINDSVKKVTNAKVILTCKENKYTIFGGFCKNAKEYSEEVYFKEIIINQLNNDDKKEELTNLLKSTTYSKEILTSIMNLKDIKQKENEIIYQAAIANKDKYKKELELLEKVATYKDSKDLISKIKKQHELDGEWTGKSARWIINGDTCYNIYSNTSYKYNYTTYYCTYSNNILYIFNNSAKATDLNNAVFKMSYKDRKLAYTSSYNTTIILSKESDNTIPKDIVKIPEPAISMTKDEVLNSTWGEPEKINKTNTRYGTREQWCYSQNKYIYFENGIVTSIQE